MFLQCGDILLLTNTHLYHSKNGVTLTMHGDGQRYNRSIIILDDNNELKLDLLRLVTCLFSNLKIYFTDVMYRNFFSTSIFLLVKLGLLDLLQQ